MTRTTTLIGIALVALVAVRPPTFELLAQSGETFTAKATPGNATEGNTSITITFTVDRYTTDAENTAVLAALKQGPAALQTALKGMPKIGTVSAANRVASLKYAYKRPQNAGQTVTLVADEPLAYLDPGAAKDKPKAGYDLALARLDFSTPGFGVGELDPAAKIGINATGQIFTQEYGAAVVRLTSVTKK